MQSLPGNRLFAWIGVFLLCGATLAAEVVLTRIFALQMWHHFTYVVIAMALLGFGAAGSWVTAGQNRRRWQDDPDGMIARYTLAAGIAIPVAYVMTTRIAFEPLRIATDMAQVVSLLLIYGVVALPFFFAGVAVCGAITFYRARVGEVYFVDLAGAGCGAAAAASLIGPLGAPALLVVLGLVLVAAAAMFWLSSAAGAGRLGGALRAAAALAIGALMAWRGLPPAQEGKIDPPLVSSKDMAPLQRAGFLEYSRWSPLGRIDVSKELEVTPMMGGVFKAGTEPHPLRVLYQDGAAPTMFIKWEEAPGRMDFLRASTTGAAFPVLAARDVAAPETVAIGVGGGVDLRIALAWGARRVTGIEVNDVTVGLLRDRYADYVGGLASLPQVELVHGEGRSYMRGVVARGERTFDLVQLSGVDTYTALSAGAYSLSESYLYTQEAVRDFLAALSDRGVVSYSRFVFPEQPRETLRLAATAVAALEDQGVADAWRHLFVLYGDQAPFRWATVLIARQPFSAADVAAVRGFCTDNGFPLLFDPEQPGFNRAFDECLRATPAAREEFFAAYPYDVRPARDDRPFFFNFFRWSKLLAPGEFGGHVYKDTYPVGHLMLVVALLQTLVLGFFLILRPVSAGDIAAVGGGLRRRGTLAALVYFSALGIGFIVLEIALMQKLVLFLGHPTWSLTLVLPSMLIGAGLGALTVGPRTVPGRRLALLLVLAPAAIAGTWWFVHHGLDALLDRPFTIRAATAVGVLLPLSFVLGMAFPTGIRVLDRARPELVPWAWAVNGFTSVLGSTGAVMVAMEVGFSAVMLGVGGLYLVGVLALLLTRRRGEPVAAAGA